MRLLRACQHKAMPWKNGRGLTREVAVGTIPGEDAPGEDAPFLWRVSLAVIRESGPFSTFPGVDRTIVALRGGPVTLRVEGQPQITLEALGEPFRFAGEAAVEAICEQGETVDLNIMTRRAQATHVMQRLALQDIPVITNYYDISMIIFTGLAELSDGHRVFTVNALDVLADIGSGETVSIEKASRTPCYRIGIDFGKTAPPSGSTDF